MEIDLTINEHNTKSQRMLSLEFRDSQLRGIAVIISQSAWVYPELIGCICEGYNWGKQGYTLTQTGTFTLITSLDYFEKSLIMYEINGEGYVQPTYIDQLALMKIVYKYGIEVLRIFKDDEIVQDEFTRYRNLWIKYDSNWDEAIVNKRLNPEWVYAMNEELEKLSSKINPKKE